MLAAAPDPEVNQYMAELAAEREEAGCRVVVRNGHHPPWTVVTGAGPVEVRAPRVNDHRVGEETGERKRFSSKVIALAEGPSESIESWADLLRDCRRRGMRDPELVVGDGAMGLWEALAEVFPAARRQRCWVHKARNVTNALPKTAQPGATKTPQEMCNAGDGPHAEKAIKAFARTRGAKWRKAAAKITDDADELPACYGFPAGHGIHLRTTDPIESAFPTVKLRTRVSPAAALVMVFKLVESARARRRAITGARLVPLVRADARFGSGHLAERPGGVTA